METYDVITLGAGGAAYPAAFRLKKSGYSVLMIDKKGIMSGNCLAEGCVPSKAIIETVHNYSKLKKFGKYSIAYEDIVKHKDDVQNIRYKQHDEELHEAGLKILKGTAKLIDENTVEVETDTGKERYRAESIIIGTGSDTYVPKIPGAELAWTSRELYALNPKVRKLPKSIAIIGGGYIGLETASFMSLLGTDVTVIELLDRVLSTMDSGMVSKLVPLLPKMNLILSSPVKEIRRGGDMFEVSYDHEGKTEKIRVEAVLMAVGRMPMFPEGLDDLGIKYDKHGIKVNMAMQTNIKHIYATGDVNGLTPLFHAAKRQSLVAANNIMANHVPVDYFDPLSVPFTVYTVPQVAYVGILPDQAKKLGISYIETDYQMEKDAMAQVNSEMEGEIRLFFDSRMKIIGGYVIGNDAGNLINEIALGISKGLSARDFAEMAHQHPMSFEGLDSAARKLY
ncbi:pyruvate dehydrogenase E3 / dihydrolipoamide dehydrogenase [Thermoplasma volcanium GSS1]|uniref:Pyruvate dehydrogenase E3 / dihydrolipoamide dehydrogenase n=1 Tax=Thermoplasma volcanium (strain ATCC 51530 / DSM 4299 / JCM 9571 / NBRC 15438 / GSS1) TaxID=273116 RepID=Q978K3_THEVO|nr:dihydrolipoyl dehydrogenase [Thermoplasma volcanium]BAB60554.1 pyruvate dehydrogenase E3 / dihydrolipoamide dehydrogenase [Thermoplasma volcanium GSS1]